MRSTRRWVCCQEPVGLEPRRRIALIALRRLTPYGAESVLSGFDNALRGTQSPWRGAHVAAVTCNRPGLLRRTQHAARSTCSLLMFQAIVTSDHSPRAFSNPRTLIWLQPITRLMIPKTGSTVCLRNSYRARLFFIPQPVRHPGDRVQRLRCRRVGSKALKHRNMV